MPIAKLINIIFNLLLHWRGFHSSKHSRLFIVPLTLLIGTYRNECSFVSYSGVVSTKGSMESWLFNLRDLLGHSVQSDKRTLGSKCPAALGWSWSSTSAFRIGGPFPGHTFFYMTYIALDDSVRCFSLRRSPCYFIPLLSTHPHALLRLVTHPFYFLKIIYPIWF